MTTGDKKSAVVIGLLLYLFWDRLRGHSEVLIGPPIEYGQPGEDIYYPPDTGSWWPMEPDIFSTWLGGTTRAETTANELYAL